jgi:hypothetical protein
VSGLKRVLVVCALSSLLLACGKAGDSGDGDQRDQDIKTCVYDAVLAYPTSDPDRKLTIAVPSCASLDTADREMVANHLGSFTEAALLRLASEKPKQG